MTRLAIAGGAYLLLLAAHHHIQLWFAQALIFHNLHWCFQVIDWGCSFRAMV